MEKSFKVKPQMLRKRGGTKRVCEEATSKVENQDSEPSWKQECIEERMLT